jgi:hypothetical protein
VYTCVHINTPAGICPVCENVKNRKNQFFMVFDPGKILWRYPGTVLTIFLFLTKFLTTFLAIERSLWHGPGKVSNVCVYTSVHVKNKGIFQEKRRNWLTTQTDTTVQDQTWWDGAKVSFHCFWPSTVHLCTQDCARAATSVHKCTWSFYVFTDPSFFKVLLLYQVRMAKTG